MIWLNAQYTYMILNMKIAPYYIACSVVLAGILISAGGDPLRAADVAPSKFSAEKSSPEETKKDNPAAKAKDAAQQEQIDKLIEQLGDKDYYIRQRAQNELARLSFDAFDALTEATTNDDLEIASRAKYLLRLMRVEWMAKNDPPEVKEKLKDYELQPEETRQARMHDLAVMSEGKGLLALCRLIRFEKSDVLSKIGVIELLKSPSGFEPPKGPLAETIRKLFEKRGRTSASWMLAWLRLADDPQAISQWNNLIQAEFLLLQRSPGESNREIVSSLIRYQTAWLKKHGQTEEATAAMRRLIDLEDNGDLETLSELLDWLVEQKAWKLVDELAARHISRFESEPLLLYILAQSQKEQGEAAKAEETAHRAFGLNASREETNLLSRYVPLNLMNLNRNMAGGGGEEIKLFNRYIIAQRFCAGGDCSIGQSANWNMSLQRAAPRILPRSAPNGAYPECFTKKAMTWRPPMCWMPCSKQWMQRHTSDCPPTSPRPFKAFTCSTKSPSRTKLSIAQLPRSGAKILLAGRSLGDRRRPGQTPRMPDKRPGP